MIPLFSFRVEDDKLLIIDTGDDNDFIKIDGLMAANANIACGSGNDYLILNNASDTAAVTSSTATTVSNSTSSGGIFTRNRQLATQLIYSINVTTGDDNDKVFIKTIPDQCLLEVDLGNDHDEIKIDGLGFGSDVTVLGGAGDDILLLDGREDVANPSLGSNTMVCY